MDFRSIVTHLPAYIPVERTCFSENSQCFSEKTPMLFSQERTCPSKTLAYRPLQKGKNSRICPCPIVCWQICESQRMFCKKSFKLCGFAAQHPGRVANPTEQSTPAAGRRLSPPLERRGKPRQTLAERSPCYTQAANPSEAIQAKLPVAALFLRGNKHFAQNVFTIGLLLLLLQSTLGTRAPSPASVAGGGARVPRQSDKITVSYIAAASP